MVHVRVEIMVRAVFVPISILGLLRMGGPYSTEACLEGFLKFCLNGSDWAIMNGLDCVIDEYNT